MAGNSGEKNLESPGTRRKITKIALIVFILVVLTAGSSAATFKYFGGFAGEGDRPAKPVKVETKDMGDMVVNLSGNGNRYLRINIVLEYPKDKKLADEIYKKQHQLADALISVLRGKTYSDVADQGKFEYLKKDLLKEVNIHLTRGEISNMYFTDFLVQ